MRRYLFLLISAVLSPASAAEPLQYNRDVRPILADACYHCHGPDKNQRKANLRLDVEEDAKAVRKGRTPIVPKKPNDSELIRRILSDDPAEQMPPPHSGRQITQQQKETLRHWIEQGATWQKHWAFIAPKRPEAPRVENKNWVRNPIDEFILARLERERLNPSPEASPNTLIRRLSFDLTGLPPTPSEVDEFVKEYAVKPRPAYEKLVDRLLASKRYGERMAWRWLEAARYADTNGYQTDAERDMYRWRDWVIDAYNRNLPFDQFTIEQLAGDLLPDATLEQKIATAFNRNHRGNSEGGIVPEEYAAEYVADRVETTSTVWLGLTLGCTRCHDHKYDPFSQKEFYQLFAYFNNVPEKGRAVKFGNSPPYIKAPTKEQIAAANELQQKCIVAEKEYNAIGTGGVEDWRVKNDLPMSYDWAPTSEQILHLSFDEVNNRNLFFRDGDPAFVGGKIDNAADLDGKRFIDAGNVGDFGFHDKFSFSFWVNPRNATGALVSRMAEEPQSEGYGIFLVKGRLQVHLTKRWLDDALRVETVDRLDVNQWHHIVVTYDGSCSAKGVSIFIDGSIAETVTLLDELNQSFKNGEPLRIGSGGGRTSRFSGQIDELRVYTRELDSIEADVLAVPLRVGELLRNVGGLTPSQSRKLLECYLHEHSPPALRNALMKRKRLNAEHSALEDSFATVMVMEEMRTPRETYLLVRGEYDKRGERVFPNTPASLSPLPKGVPNNRLGLAKWLVDPANPLTARVTVNRMWQLHFGMGLVKTGEDFGTQGDYPIHPELLDWLATEFTSNGWDIKKLHKTIVMSATYRQSSRMTKELIARDPDNRLLARGPRQRLSAEMVRDQALFASGLLVEKLGGPSVKPYQPSGLWKELSGAEDYKQDKGENLYRRSLYTYWKRTVSPPSLMTFDASTRETCVVRETRTNTPLQALTLLNDVTYVEAARLMAQRVLKVEKSAEQRIERAFKLVISRSPSPAEAQIIRQSYERQLTEYRKNPDAAKKLLHIGETKPDAKLDVAELAAYANICSMILNLDEAVTKE